MTLDETLRSLETDEGTGDLLEMAFDQLTESKSVQNAVWNMLDNFIPPRSPVRKSYQKYAEICRDLKVIMAMVYLAGRAEGQRLALEELVK